MADLNEPQQLAKFLVIANFAFATGNTYAPTIDNALA